MSAVKQAAATLALAALTATGVSLLNQPAPVVNTKDREWKTTVDQDRPAFTMTNSGSELRMWHPDEHDSLTARKRSGKTEMTVGNRTHRFYDIPGAFEYEIEYAERPLSNVEVLHIDGCEKFDFVYQGELTAEQKARGAFRPENVIGSYAVYNKATGRKFGHIYRPLLKDAGGDEEWATMRFDPRACDLSLRMPGKWLDAAAYPTILDPTIGKTNVGATVDTLPSNYIQAFGPYSPASNCTANSMSLYTSIAGVTFKMLLYGQTAGAPGALLDKTGDVVSVTSNWATGNVLTGVPLTAGTNYYVSIMQSNTITSRADVETETDYYINGQVYGIEPNPFPGGATTDHLVKSLYLTCTATSAVGSININLD